MVVSKSLMER